MALPVQSVVARPIGKPSLPTLPALPTFEKIDDAAYLLEIAYQDPSLSQSLQRIGIEADEAATAMAALGPAAIKDWQAGARLKVEISDRAGKPSLSSLELIAEDTSHRIERDKEDFIRRPSTLAALKQIRADDKTDLYWQLRANGVAADMVETLSATMEEAAPLVAILKMPEGSSAPALIGLAQLQDGRIVRIASAKRALPTRTTADDVVSGRISSSFGYRRHPILGFLRLHEGMDIAAPSGTPVRAAADGIVRIAGWAGGYGKRIELSHGASDASRYGHLSAMTVQTGDQVRKGDIIGFVGSTGFTTGPHLHYEWRHQGRAVDPASIVHERDPVPTLAEADQRRQFERWLLLAEPA